MCDDASQKITNSLTVCVSSSSRSLNIRPRHVNRDLIEIMNISLLRVKRDIVRCYDVFFWPPHTNIYAPHFRMNGEEK